MINIVTVKWGDKYSAEAVNKLNHSIALNTYVKYNIYCYTDDPTGLHPYIKVIPIEDNLEVWWNKLALFQEDFGGIKGKIIYFDLDIVIQKNLTPILKYDSFTLIKCFWKPYKEIHKSPIRNDHNINSSVMVWNANENIHIWDHFNTDPEYFMLEYRGIDGFMFHEDLEAEFFKENLIYSRLYGINEDSWYNPGTDWYLKEAIICIMNGQTTKEDYIKLQIDINKL